MMPPSLDNLFQKNKDFHSYNTRSANKLRTPKIKSILAEKFKTTTGVNIWNQLVGNLDTTQNISTFKQKLITHLISNYED